MLFTLRVMNPTEKQKACMMKHFKERSDKDALRGGFVVDEQIDCYFKDTFLNYVRSKIDTWWPNSNMTVFRGWPR